MELRLRARRRRRHRLPLCVIAVVSFAIVVFVGNEVARARITSAVRAEVADRLDASGCGHGRVSARIGEVLPAWQLARHDLSRVDVSARRLLIGTTAVDLDATARHLDPTTRHSKYVEAQAFVPWTEVTDELRSSQKAARALNADVVGVAGNDVVVSVELPTALGQIPAQVFATVTASGDSLVGQPRAVRILGRTLDLDESRSDSASGPAALGQVEPLTYRVDLPEGLHVAGTSQNGQGLRVHLTGTDVTSRSFTGSLCSGHRARENAHATTEGTASRTPRSPATPADVQLRNDMTTSYALARHRGGDAPLQVRPVADRPNLELGAVKA